MESKIDWKRIALEALAEVQRLEAVSAIDPVAQDGAEKQAARVADARVMSVDQVYGLDSYIDVRLRFYGSPDNGELLSVLTSDFMGAFQSNESLKIGWEGRVDERG